ncbi:MULTISPECIES: SMI1/KNR4 family protein [Brevibacillus]|uniref:SMI1/KNR4 family protein n=1 Tax=Brevibacillus TaxID=55080 RepID=UPI000D10C49A|nr:MULTISPECIES: SMI1/KNR4 family protein [Brevibacillus]MED1946761.1 SMI1/KNR4 family protein [Brevibacillus formosus]MED1997019.1 SMI1/KNR4 family protein [Brevibacillus formosus]MED2084936.1 SMI1/KNR4 family protein [Brevibacillus formosus]PSK20249.1 SMI1/KNR4 family protein [Brevibacillus sp. NRRL NRS-603]
MEKIIEFLTWAEEKGWEVKKRIDRELTLTNEIANRYPVIPEQFDQFLKRVDTCVAADEKSWFLCVNDYNREVELAFSWDEFKKISLESACDDDSWKQEITKFWDRYLPIALSVRNGYTYYAIDLGSEFGSIVCGSEPEFEEAEQIASSFNQFLDKIMKNSVNFASF